jgi:hypothetical protein
VARVKIRRNQTYHGITYPFFKVMPRWFRKAWKRIMCPRGYHLLDEVLSTYGSEPSHYLYCDACDMEIVIAWIDAPDVEKGHGR